MNIHGQIYRVSTAAQQQMASVAPRDIRKGLENSNNNI